MNSITRIDGSPYFAEGNWVWSLHEDVEVLIASKVSTLLWKTVEKQAFREATARVQEFLSWIDIQANLINGDYEAVLKMIASSPSITTDKFKEFPNKTVLVALLARLKGTKKRRPMPRSRIDERELDIIVDRYIANNWDSASSAISILASR